MIHSTVVQQVVSYRPVGYELKDTIDRLNSQGCEIISIHETKVNSTYNEQAFIIIYRDNDSDTSKGCAKDDKPSDTWRCAHNGQFL